MSKNQLEVEKMIKDSANQSAEYLKIQNNALSAPF